MAGLDCGGTDAVKPKDAEQWNFKRGSCQGAPLKVSHVMWQKGNVVTIQLPSDGVQDLPSAL